MVGINPCKKEFPQSVSLGHKKKRFISETCAHWYDNSASARTAGPLHAGPKKFN